MPRGEKSAIITLVIEMKDNGIMGNLPEYMGEVGTEEPYSGYKFKVADVLTITILGLICGLQNMKMIYQWTTTPRIKDFLREKFGIVFIPKYVQFTNILGNVNPDELNKQFIKWAQNLVGEVCGKTISIDGKTIKSSVAKHGKKGAFHIVSAYVSELGLTIGQTMVEAKKNEIPAVQDLLELLDISGAIVVADALNCQKKTAKMIVEKGGDYLLSVKKNQGNLLDDVEAYFKLEPKKFEKISKSEKNGGRIERRTAWVCDDFEQTDEMKKWADLCCIGVIKTEFETKKGKSEEFHYYISSAPLTVENLLKHARLEWGVESMHWLLDVHFGEDKCLANERNTQFTLNILRKIVLNLLKVYKAKNGIKKPVSNIMAECLFDEKNIVPVLFAALLEAFVTNITKLNSRVLRKLHGNLRKHRKTLVRGAKM